MESNKQERKNLVDDNPVQKEASALKNVNKGYGQEVKSPMAMMKSKKPSTAFAMKMSETKSALPMSSRKLDKMFKKGMPDSPLQMKGDLDKDGKMSGYESKRQMAIEKNMSDSPAKMYDKSPVQKKNIRTTKSVDNLGAARGSNNKSLAGSFTAYDSKNSTLANDNDIKNKTVIKKAATQVKESKGKSRRSTKKAVRQGKRFTAKSERVAKRVKRLENRVERVSLKGKQATEAGKTGANSRARDLVAKKARLQKRIKNKEKANK